MSFQLRFALPGTPDLPNQVRTGNWRATWSHKKKWKAWTVLAARSAALRELIGRSHSVLPLQRSRLVLTRCSSVEPDPDNLAASFKAVIDGLTEAGVIENDRSCNVTIEFRWRKVPPKMGKVIVEVYQV